MEPRLPRRELCSVVPGRGILCLRENCRMRYVSDRRSDPSLRQRAAPARSVAAAPTRSSHCIPRCLGQNWFLSEGFAPVANCRMRYGTVVRRVRRCDNAAAAPARPPVADPSRIAHVTATPQRVPERETRVKKTEAKDSEGRKRPKTGPGPCSLWGRREHGSGRRKQVPCSLCSVETLGTAPLLWKPLVPDRRCGNPWYRTAAVELVPDRRCGNPWYRTTAVETPSWYRSVRPRMDTFNSAPLPQPRCLPNACLIGSALP